MGRPGAPAWRDLTARAADLLLLPLRREPALTLFLVALHVAMPLAGIPWYFHIVGSDLFLFCAPGPNLCMGLLLGYLLALTLGHWRASRMAATLLALLPYAGLLELKRLFNLGLDADVVTMVIQTNQREAGEFCSRYLLQGEPLGLLLAALALTVAVEGARQPTRRLLRRLPHPATAKTAGTLLLAPALIYGAAAEADYVAASLTSDWATYDGLMQRHRKELGSLAPPLNSLLASVGYLRCMTIDIARNAALSRALLGSGPEALESCGDDSLTVVVVMGETCIRHRQPLYGYPLPTTPWLSAQTRLVAYDNAVSSHTHTTSVVMNAFCLNDPARQESIADHPFWPALFAAAGWHVDIHDFQEEPPESYSMYFEVTNYLFPKGLRDSLYSVLDARALTCDPAQVARETAGRKLIVYHLMGQHVRYSDRFPPSFARFATADMPRDGRPWMTDEKRQEEADYANATLYNDHVVSQIAASVETLDAVMLYFGDHGEEIYDYRDCLGRRMEDPSNARDFLLCQAAVPLMAWWTEAFERQHPDRVAELRAAAHQPIYTPLIGHAALHLAGIRGGGYDPTRDFLSHHYVPHRRLVNGRHDFDAIVGHGTPPAPTHE